MICIAPVSDCLIAVARIYQDQDSVVLVHMDHLAEHLGTVVHDPAISEVVILSPEIYDNVVLAKVAQKLVTSGKNVRIFTEQGEDITPLNSAGLRNATMYQGETIIAAVQASPLDLGIKQDLAHPDMLGYLNYVIEKSLQDASGSELLRTAIKKLQQPLFRLTNEARRAARKCKPRSPGIQPVQSCKMDGNLTVKQRTSPNLARTKITVKFLGSSDSPRYTWPLSDIVAYVLNCLDEGRGNLSRRELARQLRISPTTLYKYLTFDGGD